MNTMFRRVVATCLTTLTLSQAIIPFISYNSSYATTVSNQDVTGLTSQYENDLDTLLSNELESNDANTTELMRRERIAKSIILYNIIQDLYTYSSKDYKDDIVKSYYEEIKALIAEDGAVRPVQQIETSNTRVLEFIEFLDKELTQNATAQKIGDTRGYVLKLIKARDTLASYLKDLDATQASNSSVEMLKSAKLKLNSKERKAVDIALTKLGTKIGVLKNNVDLGLLTESVTLAEDPEIAFNADDMYASIFDQSTQRVTKDFLGIMAISATLEPLVDSSNDLANSKLLNSAQSNIISQWGSRRKPLYIAYGTSVLTDYSNGRTIRAVPATLANLKDANKKAYTLFLKTGNDNSEVDTNTTQASPQTNANGTVTVQVSKTTDKKSFVPVFSAGIMTESDERASQLTKLITSSGTSSISENAKKSSVLNFKMMTYNSILVQNILNGKELSNLELKSPLFIDPFSNILLDSNVVLIPASANGSILENDSQPTFVTKAWHNNYPTSLLAKSLSRGKWQLLCYDVMGETKVSGAGKIKDDLSVKVSLKSILDMFSFKGEMLMPDTPFIKILSTEADNKLVPLYEIRDKDALDKNDTSRINAKIFDKVDVTMQYMGEPISLTVFQNLPQVNDAIHRSNTYAYDNQSVNILQPFIADIAHEASLGKDGAESYAKELSLQTTEVSQMRNIGRNIAVYSVDKILDVPRGFAYLTDPQTHPVLSKLLTYKRITTAIGVIMAAFLLWKLISEKATLPVIIIGVSIFLLIFVLGFERISIGLVDGYNKLLSVDIIGVSDRHGVYRTSAAMEERRIAHLNDIDKTQDNVYRSNGSADYKNLNGRAKINLYKLDPDVFKFYYKDGVPRETRFDLGDGLFIEGDYVKIYVDDLFSKASIQDEFVSTSSGEISRQFTVTLVDTDKIDNFTNYYTILKHIAIKTHEFANLSAPATDTIRYSADMIKKRYIWSALAESSLILDYKETNILLRNNPDLLRKVKLSFDQDDVFGLRKLVDLKTTVDEANNIQYGFTNETEIGNRFLGHYVKPDSDYVNRVNSFVRGGNYRIQQFLMNSVDYLPYMSDETVTKVISLIVLEEFNTVFTQPIIQPDEQVFDLYPKYQDLSELSYEAMLFDTNEDVNVISASEESLVRYIETKYDLLGDFLLPVACVLISIGLFIISWAPFTLIALVLIITFFKMFAKMDVKDTITGFLVVFTFYLIIGFLHAKILLSVAPLETKLVTSTIFGTLLGDLTIAYIKALYFSFGDMGLSAFPFTAQKSIMGRAVLATASGIRRMSNAGVDVADTLNTSASRVGVPLSYGSARESVMRSMYKLQELEKKYK